MKANRNVFLLTSSVLVIAALLFLVRGQGPARESSLAPQQADDSVVSVAQRAGVRAPLSRAPSRQSAAPEENAVLIATLATTLSTDAASALREEVDGRFADFLASLDVSPQQKAEIRSGLLSAYGDILAFGAAIQRGEISAVEAEARSDPNYVLNQMSALLSPEELNALEVYMEEAARRQFLSTYEPQMQVVGVDLTSDNSERLLETLFTETYLSVNADGIGAASNLASRFQRQLDAIANTRDSLRLSMSPQQFAQADKFLDEQERGLLGAQTIFSAN